MPKRGKVHKRIRQESNEPNSISVWAAPAVCNIKPGLVKWAAMSLLFKPDEPLSI